MTAIASFTNQFDATEVTLTAANDSTDHDARGPWTVKLIFNDPAIGTEHKSWSFDSMREAHEQFQQLVEDELFAIREEID